MPLPVYDKWAAIDTVIISAVKTYVTCLVPTLPDWFVPQ